jgi:tRNA U34 5-methylaminomethyl-2-thiouridine-forming methyltransferase MnmC
LRYKYTTIAYNVITEKLIQLTEDGSHTVAIPSINVTYHSRHGAVQESTHVYIEAGLLYFINHNNIAADEAIHLLEIGFGTGLNAVLSLQQALKYNKKITYQTTEPFPLSTPEILKLNYTTFIHPAIAEYFYVMHTCNWNEPVALHPLFSFYKTKTTAEQFRSTQPFHIIYFDAFDPVAQPLLWTEAIFKNMFNLLHNKGILVTYCSKGSVQRAMKAAGFSIEKLKGPPGKREILRARKL